MVLEFTVNKQQLTRVDDNMIASYSKNFLRCKFYCSKPWGRLYKYALFINVKGKETIVELGTGKEVFCVIPENILTGNFFYVSIFADDRLTTTQQMVLIQPSGITDSISESIDSGSMETEEDFDVDYRDRIYEYDTYYPYDPEHLYF